MDELSEKLPIFIKEHGIALSLGIAGISCLVFGLLSFRQSQKPQNTDGFQTIPTDTSQARPPLSPIAKQITVDVEGSVQKPGVYSLPANSRIQNALIAAGGLSDNVDRQLVSQNVNLAAPLTDGAKIYIPAVDEQLMTFENTSDGGSTADGTSSKIENINQVSETDLDALPGVGPVTAQKIIDNRPYQNVQELLDKKVVGRSVFSKIKDQITVY